MRNIKASLMSVKPEGLLEDFRIANAVRLLVQAKILISILIYNSLHP